MSGCVVNEAANHQFPSLLNHLNSCCGGMFKLNAKFDAALLLYSLSHLECDSHTVHMLTQWHLPPPMTSTVKWPSLMQCTHILIHSPRLPGYISVVQTILVILTMVGLFPDIPNTCI